MERQAQYKLVIVGNTQVGKTCIIESLTSGKCKTDVPATIGASFMLFNLLTPKGEIKLNLWDTAVFFFFSNSRARRNSCRSLRLTTEMPFSHSLCST